MASRTTKQYLSALALATLLSSAAAAPASADLRFVQISASTREQRSAIADTGVSIEATRSDSVWGFADPESLARVKSAGFRILGDFAPEIGRGGHEGIFDFPHGDERFHDYKRTLEALKQLETANSDIARLQAIGHSVEGRDLVAIHINTTPEELANGTSAKPGAIFMGNHHAREHVSLEIPLMLAQYLLEHRSDPSIAKLLSSRDLWVIPMVNPDGAEYDVATGKYRYWRKNRVKNKDGTYGVDLNRNYSFGWGTGGSSHSGSSDTFMGPSPFSEPETQAIRDFVDAHSNARTLLTFHTYSELILYPWGGKYDPIPNAKDHAVFDKMAKTMAGWNHYTPEQASQLYIASGDTVDWAYGTHGIFAFTFELSPSDVMDGGFYPGAGVIDRVFNDNLKPCLYLIDVAGDPYQVLQGGAGDGFLRNYVEPGLGQDTLD